MSPWQVYNCRRLGHFDETRLSISFFILKLSFWVFVLKYCKQPEVNHDRCGSLTRRMEEEEEEASPKPQQRVVATLRGTACLGLPVICEQPPNHHQQHLRRTWPNPASVSGAELVATSRP